MALKNLSQPSRGIAGSARGLSRSGLTRPARGFQRGILLADGPLLLPAGQGIAGRLRIFDTLLGREIPKVGVVQPLFRLLGFSERAQLVRMIGVLAHLQGRSPEPIALERCACRNVVILVGLCKLPVQLIVCRLDGALYRMPEPGGWFRLRFLKPKADFLSSFRRGRMGRFSHCPCFLLSVRSFSGGFCINRNAAFLGCLLIFSLKPGR